MFLTVNPTSLMGWLASLGFSDIFVDCLIAMGRYFPSMIYVL